MIAPSHSPLNGPSTVAHAELGAEPFGDLVADTGAEHHDEQAQCLDSHARDTRQPQGHAAVPPHEDGQGAADAGRRRRGRAGQEASTSSRIASALSSLVFSASASSDTRIWRAFASIRFSPARQATLTLAAPEVAHDLGHLDDVAAGQLLEVGLVAARPVGRLLGVRLAQHVEDAVETLLVHDVAHADEVDVVRRNADGQVTLGDAQDEVVPLDALDRPLLDGLDGAAPWCG